MYRTKVKVGPVDVKGDTAKDWFELYQFYPHWSEIGGKFPVKDRRKVFDDVTCRMKSDGISFSVTVEDPKTGGLLLVEYDGIRDISRISGEFYPKAVENLNEDRIIRTMLHQITLFRNEKVKKESETHDPN